VCLNCGSMTISHSVTGFNKCTTSCDEGQCCDGDAGFGLSPDGTSCGLCPVESCKSSAGPGKCTLCAEGTVAPLKGSSTCASKCQTAGWYDTAAEAAASPTLGTADGVAITDGPGNYPAHQSCFKAYKGCTSVVFTNFDSQNDDAYKDGGALSLYEEPNQLQLSLYNGPTDSSAVLIDKAQGTTIPTHQTPTADIVLFKFDTDHKSTCYPSRAGFDGVCLNCGGMTISHSVAGATKCATSCAQGECCDGDGGFGLSLDGTSCGICPAASYKSSAGPGKCVSCSESNMGLTGCSLCPCQSILQSWTTRCPIGKVASPDGLSCLVPGMTWVHAGSSQAGQSCDAVCAASDGKGGSVTNGGVKCAKEGFLLKWSDVVLSSLAPPSTCGGEFSGTNGKVAASTDLAPCSRLQDDGVVICDVAGTGSTCADKQTSAVSIRRMCPCGCPSNTYSAKGDKSPCLP
jgi:hypothetical protein